MRRECCWTKACRSSCRAAPTDTRTSRAYADRAAVDWGAGPREKTRPGSVRTAAPCGCIASPSMDLRVVASRRTRASRPSCKRRGGFLMIAVVASAWRCAPRRERTRRTHPARTNECKPGWCEYDCGPSDAAARAGSRRRKSFHFRRCAEIDGRWPSGHRSPYDDGGTENVNRRASSACRERAL